MVAARGRPSRAGNCSVSDGMVSSVPSKSYLREGAAPTQDVAVPNCTDAGPMQHLDWRDLRVALALARHGSLGEAGRVLRLDATTVSRRITGLEEATGAA